MTEFSNATLESVLTHLVGVHAARSISTTYTTWTELSRATVDDLCRLDNVGRARAMAIRAAIEMASRLSREVLGETPLCDSPEVCANLLREETRPYTVETCHILLLNTRRRLIRQVKLADGTLDSVMVHPREVFRPAIAANAAAVVLGHRHFSGDPTPSESDIRVTRDLIRAGQLMRIEVLDHVILGQRTPERERDFVSLRELGFFC